MKNLPILILLCFVNLIAMAQVSRPDPTPITRDSALKFKTGQEALGIPLTDSIVSGTISSISKNSNDVSKWKPAKGMADPIIQQMIQQSRYRDRLMFSDFVVIENGKEKKLDTKVFVFKDGRN